MNRSPRNLFAKQTPSKDFVLHDSSGDVAQMVSQTKRGSRSLLATWRMQRTADAKNTELLTHNLEVIFEAKRKEVEHEVSLILDFRKKAALANHLADTAVLDKELVRWVRANMDDTMKEKIEAAKHAARLELATFQDFSQMLARGEITEARFQQVCKKNEEDTDKYLSDIDAMTQQVIENLGEQLGNTLRSGERSGY